MPIVDGVERYALNYGWNVIECDGCKAIKPLNRTHDTSRARAEAREAGWVYREERDLCPSCA